MIWKLTSGNHTPCSWYNSLLGQNTLQNHASGLAFTPSRLWLRPQGCTYNTKAAYEQQALQLIEYNPINAHPRTILVSFPVDPEQGKNTQIRRAKVATWKDKSTRNPTTKTSLCTKIIRLGKQKNCIQDGLVRISLCPPLVLTPEIISFLGTIIFYTRSVIREKMAFCRCCCTLVSNIVYLLKVYCYIVLPG